MEKYLALAPAASAAARLRAQAITLDRMIDSARRGADVDPAAIAREMAASIKIVTRELARV